MKQFLLLFLLFSSTALSSQAPITEWAKNQGGSAWEFSFDVTTDKWGNVYNTGTIFSQDHDFDPGPDQFLLSTTGFSRDIYVSKLSPNGEFMWAVSVGGINDDEGYGVATDTFGNIYITGKFEGVVDFNPGPGVYSLDTGFETRQSTFILKLNNDGEFIWAKSLEWEASSWGESYGEAIVVDDNANIYITGDFENTTDFDPGPDVYTLNSNQYGDMFVLKLNGDGEFIWANSFGGNRFDESRGIALDNSNNVYISGYTKSSNTNYGLFIAKMDSNGSIIWERKMEATTEDGIARGYDLVVDADQNVYTTGYFIEGVDFDPGPGNVLASSTTDDSGDLYILKLDSNGDFVWVKTIGGTLWDVGRSIALDKNNELYIVGDFRGSADFDPGPEESYLYTISEEDGFVLMLDIDGNYIRSGTFRGNDTGRNYAVTIDDWNNIYTTGTFSFITDFDPFNGAYNLSAIENKGNVFIQKMRTEPCSAFPSINNGSGKVSLCPHENDVLLSVKMPTWVTSATYSWSTGETSDSISVMPVSDSNYVVNVTYFVDTVICHSSSSIDVNIAAPFEISITPDVEICKEEEIGIVATGGETYFWSNGETSDTILINAIESETYSVIVTDGYGCSKTDSTLVSVDSLPRPMLAGDFEICFGESANLTATGGEDYSWSTGKSDNSINVFPLLETEYKVTVTDGNNCMGFDSITINVNPLPDLMIDQDQTICPGDSVILTVLGEGSYLWSTSDIESSILVAPTTNTEYVVTVTGNNNCVAIDSTTVFISTLSDTTFLYAVSCDSLSIGTVVTDFTDQNGCDSVVMETTTFALIPETPVAPTDIVIQADEPPFEVTIPEVANTTEYQWTIPPGAQILSGSGTNSIVVDWSGSMEGGQICVIAANECFMSEEVCMEVTVNIIDAVKDIERKKYLVFPNPANDFIQLRFDIEEIFKLTLYDLLGTTHIPTIEFQQVRESQLGVQGLTTGIYLLKIETKGGVFWERIEIIRE